MKGWALHLMTFLLGGAAALIWVQPQSAPVAADQPRTASKDAHHLCDLSSDDSIKAFAGALSGDPDATNPFIELSVRCPDDLGMFQLVAAVELAFPRDSTRRVVGAKNLSSSISLAAPSAEEAHRAALAMALLAFAARACESKGLVVERLSALGMRDKRLELELSESLKRRGGEMEPCSPLPSAD